MLSFVLDIVNLVLILAIVVYMLAKDDVMRGKVASAMDVLGDTAKLPTTRIRARYNVDSEFDTVFKTEVMGDDENEIAAFETTESAENPNAKIRVVNDSPSE
tara:strand:+ start:2185 stop:2490 length:306 start_codon:yes stop_codon:yes gene_type:complete